MAEKKIIAVMGATGAQGGGLVRAILSDPNGGFAARAITRDVNSEKAKELAKLGRRGRRGRRRRRREPRRGRFKGAYGALLRHVLLGALFAREGAGRGHRHGPRREARRPQARHLVHARRHAQVGAAQRQSHAHPHGQVQGAALRRQGRGQPGVHRARAAHDVPA